MDKDQLKVLIDSITKGFKDVAKDLKNVSSSSSGGTGHTPTPKESNIIPVKPFFGNDDEDPTDWIRNFEIAAEANNWTNERKLKIVPGYLQGLAAYWFEEEADTITRWNATGYADSSFVPCFKEKFSTEEKQNMWHHQLNELRQGPYEKVDFYAGKFKKLLKKVDPGSALPNSYAVRLFLNGLQKNIVPLVAFSQPDTINKAISTAKQVESGQYYETQASTPTTGNDAIDVLTKQMEKLSLNYANITAALAAQLDDKKPKQRSENPPAKIWDKKDITCFRCQEKGHFAKECMSERPAIRKRNFNNREASYVGVYTDSDEEEEEEEVYAIPRNRSIPYTTDRRTARQTEADRKRQSESRREMNLRSRKPVDKFMEIETPQPVVTPKKKTKRGPSQIDQMPPYNVMQDLLQMPSSAKIGQLLQYPNQRRNLAQGLRRPKIQESNYANQDSDEEKDEKSTAV